MHDTASAVSAPSYIRDMKGTLLQRVTDLLPEIRKRAPATEKARMVSPEMIEALREAGVFRVFTPKYYGGAEGSFTEWAKALRKVSSACASTGWVLGVLTAHPFPVAFYSKKAQDEFWANGPDTLSSSAVLPTTKAKITDGGVRVTGRFPFSSGSDHAHWAQVAILVPDVTADNPESAYVPYFCNVPRGDFEIDHTWDVMGLCGTGSNDLVFKDVFIPWHRMEPYPAVWNGWGRGQGMHEGWTWNMSYADVFGTALTIMSIGMADAVVEMMTDKIRTRTIPGTRIPADSQSAYMRLAEVTHELEALSLFWETRNENIESVAKRGYKRTEAEIMRDGTSSGYARKKAMTIIDRIFEISGASAIRAESPLQRFWRDAHAAGAHMGADYDATLQRYGRFLLDLPTAQGSGRVVGF